MPRKKHPPQDPLGDLYGALPERIPVLPVRSTVIFPINATALQVGFPPNVEVLTQYPEKNLVVAVVPIEEEEMPVSPSSIEKVAVAARVLSRLNLPGGTIQTTIQGMIRVRLENVRFEGGCYTAFPRLVEEVPLDDEAAARLVDQILNTIGGVASRIERLGDVPRILRKNLGDPGRFADLVATLAHFNQDEKDEVLQRLDIGDRLNYVLQRLESEWERVRELGAADAERAASVPGRRIDETTAQIRKRISGLQAELGELDPGEKAAIDILRRVDHARLPARIASAARREAERLRMLNPSSSEAADIRAYLEAVLDVPWAMDSESGPIDLDSVRDAMDRKHVGLEDVKRRILEILSVATLRGNVRGMVPCIVGPP
ncbi:MAG TPA: LON peptidase substrate-binding domain-containing protein, partial [Longimicrobiaceae bacterium]|nr:LON peptidase substrate-binding domain-containing protein [Longimicrobiaceae bacterium]